MTCKNHPLITAFQDSFSEECLEIIPRMSEHIGMDQSTQGLLNELEDLVPIFSFFKNTIHFANSVGNYLFYRKYSVFLKELMFSKQDKIQQSNFAKKFKKKDECEKLEMIQFTISYIDQCQGIDKPKLLSKLLIALLDGEIDLPTFKKYCECVLRFMSGDYEILCSDLSRVEHPVDDDRILRLMSLGLVKLGKTESCHEFVDGSGVVNSISFDGTSKRSDAGEELVTITKD